MSLLSQLPSLLARTCYWLIVSQNESQYASLLLCVCRLFNRLILEAPVLTPNAVEILKMYCQDEVMTFI